MDSKIKEFIQENRDLIKDDAWEKVYSLANASTHNVPSEFIGEFTETLLKADINPLDHLNEVPTFFLYKSQIDRFNIPNNIERIGSFAFAGCKNLKSITIPDSVMSIGSWAFSGCWDLTGVVIGSNTASIGREAFYGCYALMRITFKGSKVQWWEISKGENWAYNTPEDCEIICNDGAVSLQ